jgi:hypothetical protein
LEDECNFVEKKDNTPFAIGHFTFEEPEHLIPVKDQLTFLIRRFVEMERTRLINSKKGQLKRNSICAGSASKTQNDRLEGRNFRCNSHHEEKNYFAAHLEFDTEKTLQQPSIQWTIKQILSGEKAIFLEKLSTPQLKAVLLGCRCPVQFGIGASAEALLPVHELVCNMELIQEEYLRLLAQEFSSLLHVFEELDGNRESLEVRRQWQKIICEGMETIFFPPHLAPVAAELQLIPKLFAQVDPRWQVSMSL